jgi:hypothetical protein
MYGLSPSLPNECSVNSQKKYQPQGWYFHFWWAHQDLNLGPKDYEFKWTTWAAPKTADGKIDYNKALTEEDLKEFVDNKLVK